MTRDLAVPNLRDCLGRSRAFDSLSTTLTSLPSSSPFNLSRVDIKKSTTCSSTKSHDHALSSPSKQCSTQSPSPISPPQPSVSNTTHGPFEAFRTKPVLDPRPT